MFPNLAAAVLDVQLRNVSRRKAALAYGIPLTTLRRHVSAPPNTLNKVGRPTVFSAIEEQSLEDMILLCADLMVGMTRKEFLGVVTECVKEKGIDFEGSLGRSWYKRFLEKHPRVSERITQAQNIRKLKVWTDETATMWIAKLELLKNDGYLNDPSRTFNYDESGFKLAVLISRTLARKGQKDPYSLTTGSDRDQITALFFGAANGTMLKPEVLFQAKLYLSKWFEGVQDIFVDKNSSGIMDLETLVRYFRKAVFPNLQPGKNVVFFDQPYSHVYNPELLKLCIQRNVRMVAFPPGETSRLQPLDRSVFGGLKKHYNDYVRAVAKSVNPVTRNTFPYHLAAVCKEANLQLNLISGFRKTGIYPFDPTVIKATVFQYPKPTKQTSPLASLDPALQVNTFAEIKILLVDNLKVSDDRAELLVDSLRQAIHGERRMMNVVTNTAAAIFERVQTKKRQPKESQLRLDNGGCIDTLEFVALVEKHQEEQKAKKAKRKPRPEPAVVAVPSTSQSPPPKRKTSAISRATKRVRQV